MKYRIEIWQYHSISETFETDDYDELVNWYKTKWSWIYEKWSWIYKNGGCTNYVFEDDNEIDDDRKYDFM